MNNERFKKVVEDCFSDSRGVLESKGKEYTGERDRLEQFVLAGAVQDIPTTQALVALMTKHFISVVKMSKRPTMYNPETWREKVGDLTNYCILLRAVLDDQGLI